MRPGFFIVYERGGSSDGRPSWVMKIGTRWINVLNVPILMAIPGRLLDLVGQGYIHLGQVQFFVLDEGDRMLDMGFIHDIRKVLMICCRRCRPLMG